MPFDGDLQPHEDGWTITVEPSPVIAKLWRRWSGEQRGAYYQLAAGLAYDAITAIQNDLLKTRRESLWLPEGIVSYLFRQLRREHNTILITIFEVEFFGPDCDPPKPGAQAPRPLDPLVLNVSGSGRRFCIDYVEGVLPPPRKDRKNRLTIKYAEDGGSLPVREYVDTSIYFTSQSFAIADTSNSLADWLRPSAAVCALSIIYYSWKLERFIQSNSVLPIGSRASSVEMLPWGMEGFAKNPRQGAGISSAIIIATDAPHVFSLPGIASRNSPKIYAQKIYPSGSP